MFNKLANVNAPVTEREKNVVSVVGYTGTGYVQDSRANYGGLQPLLDIDDREEIRKTVVVCRP